MISTRRHLLNVVLQFGRRESMACGSLAGWLGIFEVARELGD